MARDQLTLYHFLPIWNKEWLPKMMTTTGTRLHLGNMVMMLNSGWVKSHYFKAHFNSPQPLKLGDLFSSDCDPIMVQFKKMAISFH